MDMISIIGWSLAGSLLVYRLQQYLKKRSLAAEQAAWTHGGSPTINPPPIVTCSSLTGKVHYNPFQNPGLSKKEKITLARRAIQIDENVVNIAVCGNSGTGKSTFINCIRGIPDIEMTPNFQHAIQGSAPVGIMETTKMRSPYKASDERLSFLTLWDLPSVGATKTTSSDYFEDQILYAFDCILLLKANRFTQFDIDICRQALEYNIPLILVLNKGDQDVASSKKIRAHQLGRRLDKAEYDETISYTISNLKANASAELRSIEGASDKHFDKLPMFVIAAHSYRDQINGMLDSNDCPPLETPELMECICSKVLSHSQSIDVIQTKKD